MSISDLLMFLYAAEAITYPAIVIQEPTDDEEMS